MVDTNQKTIKEILPNLSESERVLLGQFLRIIKFVDIIGYRKEDGNRVRTYPCYHWKVIRSISKIMYENE